MRYWVLGFYDEIVYILDEGYNVWDFDTPGALLLGKFIDIIGCFNSYLESSVILSGDHWRRYIAFGDTADFQPDNHIKQRWRRKGYLVANDLAIYTPSLAIQGVQALVSEFGDLLHLDGREGQDIRLSDIAKRLVGGIYGRKFAITLDADIEVRFTDLWAFSDELVVHMDYPKQDKDSLVLWYAIHSHCPCTIDAYMDKVKS